LEFIFYREVKQIYQEFRPDLVLLDLNTIHIRHVEFMKKIQEIEKETYPSIFINPAASSDGQGILSV